MSFFNQEPDDYVHIQLAGDSDSGKTYFLVSMAELEEILGGPVCILDTTGGSKFERHRLPIGSEVVRIKNNVILEMAIDKLAEGYVNGTCPFAAVFVDDWTTVYERIKIAHDESKLSEYSDDVERINAIKSKSMQDWTGIKSFQSQLLRKLFDLEAHIILVAWETTNYKTEKGWNGKDKMVKDGEKAKIEKNIKYFIDASVTLKKRGNKRTFEVVSDCSKTLKNGDPATPETLAKVFNFLKENDVRRDTDEMLAEAEAEAAEQAKLPEPPDDYDGPVCEECGAATEAKVLSTTKKKLGQELCWDCAGSKKTPKK